MACLAGRPAPARAPPQPPSDRVVERAALRVVVGGRVPPLRLAEETFVGAPTMCLERRFIAIDRVPPEAFTRKMKTPRSLRDKNLTKVLRSSIPIAYGERAGTWVFTEARRAPR